MSTVRERFNSIFLGLFRKSKGEEDFSDFANKETVEDPEKLRRQKKKLVNAGRNSAPNVTTASVEGLVSSYDIPFDHEVLRYLEHLAIHHESISRAVRNIVSVSNTNSEIIFPKSIKNSQEKQLRAHWDLVSSCWYENNTGEESLMTDVFWQMAVYGCISTESEIKKDLSGIAFEHRVNPYGIYFRIDPVTGLNVPVQAISSKGYNRDLNTMQYHYFALSRLGESPYAIPPFISALKVLAIRLNMVKSFEVLMGKLGMLGFMEFLLTPPTQDDDESDKAYEARLSALLSQGQGIAEKGFEDGYLTGFDGMHKVQVSGNNVRAGDGEKLMEIVNKMVYEGIGQDPNLFGHNYSVAESYTKVLLRILGNNARQYQNKAAEYKAKRANLEFMLAGFNPVTDFNGRINPINPFGISFKYDKPLDFDMKERAETDEIITRTAIVKRDAGFATQEQASTEAGYPEPASKKAPNQSSQSLSDADKVTQQFSYYRTILDYNYRVPEGCNDDFVASFAEDFGDDDYLLSQYQSYDSSLQENFSSYISNAIEAMAKDMSKKEFTIANEVYGNIYKHLLLTLDSGFLEPSGELIRSSIGTTYEEYRKDEEGIFEGGKQVYKFDIPTGVMDALDYRVIDYLDNSDNMYLGKFIVDEDTQRRVKRFIDDFMDSSENPLDSAKKIQAFADSLESTILLEGWKISRIIATTLNKARAYASLLYINQANVKEYEIVEVMDANTCPYCRHMNGKIFKTSSAVSNIKTIIASDPSEIPNISPFATTVNIDSFKNLTTEQLASQNFTKPPFHPNCRGRIVANQ